MLKHSVCRGLERTADYCRLLPFATQGPLPFPLTLTGTKRDWVVRPASRLTTNTEAIYRYRQMDNRTGTTVQCPLCTSKAVFWGAVPETLFNCAVCGQFKMAFDPTAEPDMQGQPHPYLSAATRKAAR